MLRFHPTQWFGGVLLALTLGLWAALAQAEEFRYRYVSLDQVELPPGVIFFDPNTINNSGRIYGTAYECTDAYCEFILPHIAVYAGGAVTVLQPEPGVVYTANEEGTIGGSVLIDPTNFIEQAALFHGDQVELIPPQPGEFTSFVTAQNDSGMALVTSFGDSFTETNVLYQNGQAVPLDFGPTVTSPFFLHINNQGTISGTTYASGNGRGFRFDTRTGKMTQLDPLSTEPDSWALDINNRGKVLGYSFINGRTERIGVWNSKGKFKTYFVEGTPEFPTVSNRLLFNDNNLIVITYVSSPASEGYKNSYLVPKPGVRLNLANLVENLPSGLNLSYIQDINNHGDMIGFDFFGGGNFLLERVGATGPQSLTTPEGTIQSPSLVKNGRQGIPPAVLAMMRRHLPPLKSGSALPQEPLESLLLGRP